jgi:sirohydrochlorin cobaltochelatase
MPSLKKPGIVLAPYGSLYPHAINTYDRIRKAYEHEFPGSPILMTFTSKLMRTKLKERDGICMSSPLAALAELHEIGCRSAVVQSLHIVPGEEFHQIASLARRLNDSGKLGFDHLEIGMPLLSNLEDCMKVSSSLAAIWKGAANNEIAENLADPEKEAVLLVGHGTGHPADSQYSMMAQVLKKNHCNVFLGTLEGFPGISDLMGELKICGAKKVRLMPFLLVAGGHAEKDIAGGDISSWKSTLGREGFDVKVQLCSMGDSQKIVSVFMEHTRKALEKVDNQIVAPWK